MMNKTISCGLKHLNDELQFEIARYLDETGISQLRRVCKELLASITSAVFTDALQWRFGYLLAAKPSELTSVLNRIPEQDRNPEKIYKALVSADNDIIKQYDKKKVIAAVNRNGWALEFASNDLSNDKEVVLAAVNQNATALLYASDDLRNNPEVVLAAVNQNGGALQYDSDNLKNNKKLNPKHRRIKMYKQQSNLFHDIRVINSYGDVKCFHRRVPDHHVKLIQAASHLTVTIVKTYKVDRSYRRRKESDERNSNDANQSYDQNN